MSVCLDAFALLAWLQDESGASDVENYLSRAEGEEEFSCFLSTINLGEVFYRLVQVQDLAVAEVFWEDVRRGYLPVSLVEPTRKRVREAARLKGQYPIAFADAFAVQTAREKKVPLVTGDRELKLLESEGVLSLFWLGTS